MVSSRLSRIYSLWEKVESGTEHFTAACFCIRCASCLSSWQILVSWCYLSSVHWGWVHQLPPALPSLLSVFLWRRAQLAVIGCTLTSALPWPLSPSPAISVKVEETEDYSQSWGLVSGLIQPFFNRLILPKINLIKYQSFCVMYCSVFCPPEKAAAAALLYIMTARIPKCSISLRIQMKFGVLKWFWMH